ncbi:hypothetical protein [Nocardia fluminea]|uniref:hypothetical protein n=1 Tax=Nocardia fluminea TaxID=134984 RepID=UPI003D09CBCC
MSTLPEIPAADEQAILDRTRELQEVHARGDDDAANTLLAAMVDRYGAGVIATVMAAHDEREQLGVDVELLRLLGPRRLYGEH